MGYSSIADTIGLPSFV